MHPHVHSPRSARESFGDKSDPKKHVHSHPHSTNESCRRVVRIMEDDNVYYESTEQSVDKSLWYTAEDFDMFQHQARLLSTAMQSSDDPTTCSNSLMRVYFALRTANSVDDIQRAIVETDVTLDERTLGLQDRYLTPICNDFLVRRRHLIQQVFRLQRLPFPSEHHRTKLIQETSLLNSRATRLYANFVAQAISREMLSEDT